MSEYWKSTPKYWCKFCKAYVRDTKLEKTQHEATGRHQGAIQKSLRDLQKTKERDERDAQRAKDEVARLNGVVGPNKPLALSASSAKKPPPPAPKKQATVEERKRQMEQLAAMGVAIPEEYRRDVAMAGDWQFVSRTVIEPRTDANDSVASGERKRKERDELEDEEE
jgi:U1 zinc finger